MSPADPAVPKPAVDASVDLLDTDAAGGVALRGGLLRALGYGGGLMLSLVSAPLIIRHLGDVEFGRYASVLAVIGIVTGLTEGGVNTIALRELAVTRGRTERDRLMGDLLGLRLALTGIGFLLAVSFSGIAGYGSSLVIGTALAGLGMAAALAQTLLASVLQSQLRFGWATLIDFVRAALTTLMILILVLVDGGVVAFLAITIPAGLLALLATIVLIRRDVRMIPAFHPRRWVPLLKDTAVFAVAVAINSLYFRISLILMSLVAVAAETGYFAVSFRVMEVLVGLPALLIGAAFPIISRTAFSDRQRFDQSVSRLFDLGLMIGTFTAVGLVLAAPFAIEVLAGSREHPSTAVLQIQSLGIIATFLASATGFPLLSMHRHKGTLLANLFSLVIAAALTLTLAPEHGAKGAAVAAVSAEFVLAATNTVVLMRSGGPRLPLLSLPIVLGAGLAAVALGLVVGIHPLVQGAVGGVTFLLLLKLLGRFPPEVMEVLARRRGRSAGATPPRSQVRP